MDHEDESRIDRRSPGKTKPSANAPTFSPPGQAHASRIKGLYMSDCSHCSRVALWFNGTLVMPESNDAPPPSRDMPETVLEDYKEAATVLGASPRGAAALLRLSLQKLCIHLGEPGRHLDKDIASLVRKGLDVRVQQALDAVRVIGNEAVHPGTLDLRDDRETAVMLFQLMNLIVEKMISEPQHVKMVYDMIPLSTRERIEQRDKTKGKEG